MHDAILELQDIRKSYGRAEALAGVGLTVAAGELFGLLGPNGAGKTTLLSILAGLNAPTSGTVQLLGKPFGLAQREARRLIGLATQDLAIYPELTARENLRFFGKLYGLRGPDLESRINEMLELAELADRAEQRTGTFSGGMKRRLNLAVALVHRPRILLLDEPTTGVDPQSRNHIFERVKALNADGLTVVYTSHYMEEVQALCPRMAILDHGKLIAADTRENLLGRLKTELILECPEPTAEQMRSIAGGNWIAGVLQLKTENAATELPRILKLGIEPSRIDIRPPTLETVFLHLTGRGLRD